MIQYKNYYLKNQDKKEFFEWCLENKLHNKNTPDFNSRMQLLYTGFIETQSITAIVAFENNEVAGLLLCENRMVYNQGKIYIDPLKYMPKEQEIFDWGFYNLGCINIFVRPKFRGLGIAKKMVIDIETLRLNKLAQIDYNWYKDSKVIIEGQELSFEIASKYFKNTYISTGKPEEKYSYRQVIHDLSVKCKEKSNKIFNKDDFKIIDLEIETKFAIEVNNNKKKYKIY